ncbi:DUF4142 domain-containing protein [bacterium]|nr:DUF4142 domain-containing protein [bacterium]
MRFLTRSFVAVCFAALGLSAAALARHPDSPRPPDAPPKAVSDADFVTKAASGGMFEVQSSKMATEMAKKAECKAFAEKMIADHSKLNDELKAAAGKAGIAVPSTLAAHHEKMLADLKGARDFDAAYLSAQVKAHEEAVALFTAASASVKDPGLREFATKSLPALKTHLEHAKKHAGSGTISSR